MGMFLTLLHDLLLRAGFGLTIRRRSTLSSISSQNARRFHPCWTTDQNLRTLHAVDPYPQIRNSGLELEQCMVEAESKAGLSSGGRTNHDTMFSVSEPHNHKALTGTCKGGKQRKLRHQLCGFLHWASSPNFDGIAAQPASSLIAGHHNSS